MKSEDTSAQRRSYRVGSVTAGDYNDDSRYAEWQQVNGSIVPCRVASAANLSELFAAYNISLDADRASFAATAHALSLAATDLEYEGTRVKSPVLGRDLNPLGRGDGSYYCNGGNVGGSVSIVGAKPVHLGIALSGFGNGMNNMCTGACGPGVGNRNEPPPALPPECRQAAVCTSCCLPAWKQTPGLNPSCCPENNDFANPRWEQACCAEAFDLAACSVGPIFKCMMEHYGRLGVCVMPGMPCWEMGAEWLKKCACGGGGCAAGCSESERRSTGAGAPVFPPSGLEQSSGDGLDWLPYRRGLLAYLDSSVIRGDYFVKRTRNAKGCWHGAFSGECCDEASGDFKPEFVGIFNSYRSMCKDVPRGARCPDLNDEIRSCITRWCSIPAGFGVRGPKIHCLPSSHSRCANAAGLGFQGEPDVSICEGATPSQVFHELIHTEWCSKGHAEVKALLRRHYSGFGHNITDESPPYSCQDLCYGDADEAADIANVTYDADCCRQTGG